MDPFPRKHQDTAAPPAEALPRAAGRRILLVEDNPVCQQVTLQMLAQRGVTADVVEDGLDAVVASRQIAYDLILMDVQMPRMDGFEACAAIRRREDGGTARVPIVAMTAYAMSGDRERCLAAGMDGYLNKPVRSGELMAALTRWLTDSEAPGPAKQDPAPIHAPATRAPAAAVDAFDLSRLADVTGGFAAFEQMLLGEFGLRLPEQFGRLRAALSSGDAREIERAAHSLAGGCRTIGAEPLGLACADVEQAAEAGDLDAARAAMSAVERELERVEAWLRRRTTPRAA